MYEKELKDLEKSYEWLESCAFPDKEADEWKHVEDREDGTVIHKHKKHSTVLVKGLYFVNSPSYLPPSLHPSFLPSLPPSYIPTHSPLQNWKQKKKKKKSSFFNFNF